MSENRQCPECGAALADDAAEGLCPRCLMQAGLASEAAAGTDPPPATAGGRVGAEVSASGSGAAIAPTVR